MRASGKLLLAMLSLCISAGMVEVGARAAPGFLPHAWRDLTPLHRGAPRLNDLYVYDSETGFRLAPGLRGLRFEPSGPGTAFTIDTRTLGPDDTGFRDDGLLAPPLTVAVGDSFTFCWAPAEACWVERLQRALGSGVVNMGVPGYGGRHEVATLERYGLPLHPRLLVWAFWMNDLYDNVRQHPAITVDRWTWLERRSVLFAAARQAFRSREPRHSSQDDPTWPWSLSSGAMRSDLYHDSDIGQWLSAAALDAGWSVQEEALRRADALTRASGTHLLVLLLPSREQLYAREYHRFAPRFTEEDLDRPYALMRSLCHREALDCLDLTPLFAAHRNEPFLYEHDTHFNLLGNALVADAVLKHMREHRDLH